MLYWYTALPLQLTHSAAVMLYICCKDTGFSFLEGKPRHIVQTYCPYNAKHVYHPLQQTALQYGCLAYLLDCLAGDIVSLLFADSVVHSRRAGRILLPG